MRFYVHTIFYLLLLVVLATSCQEQEVTFLPSGESSFPSTDQVEASFFGRLLDQDLEPVIEAQVWVGERMVLSDSLGDWIIPKVEVPSRQAYIKIEAEGYFAASRVLSVLPNSTNFVRIMPTRKEEYVSLQSNTGGEVQLPDGSSLFFQPGSFVDETTGAAYDGEVRVFAYSIDGRSEASQVQMPGRLESTTEDAALISFGMVVTDLETPGGVPLQLREGMTATIRFSQEQLGANPPDTIPLWHFDEGIGTWVKEGFSVRQGNAYIGDVSHFSWWNCDMGFDLADFCIQFTCEDFTPTIVNRSSVNPMYCLSVITVDELGRRGSASAMIGASLKFCGALPVNSNNSFSLTKLDGSSVGVGPFRIGTDFQDFGIHQINCDELDPECGSQPFPRPTLTSPISLPASTTSTLIWSAANCQGANQPFLVRVASTERNSTPVIIDRPLTTSDSVTLTLPAGRRIILTMLDPNSGEVLGRQSYFPHPRVEVGTLNPKTGIIAAKGYEVKGRLLGCDEGISDVVVRLQTLDEVVLDETRSSPTGRFTLNTSECDGREVIISIYAPEGEQIISTDLYGDENLGDISICAADGNYFWKAKINGRQFSYLTCNGRAGSSGWVAYAAGEPDPDAPFFGIVHNDQITVAGNFLVGPDRPIRFNGFRLGQYSFTPSSHPFEGRLRVSEFGSVAAGIFTGTCVNSDGETIDLEVEMRFVKP